VRSPIPFRSGALVGVAVGLVLFVLLVAWILVSTQVATWLAPDQLTLSRLEIAKGLFSMGVLSVGVGVVVGRLVTVARRSRIAEAEARELKEAAERREQHLQRAIGRMGTPVLQVDPRGRLLALNEVAAQTLGLSSQHTDGSFELGGILGEDWPERLEGPVRLAVEQKGSWHGEVSVTLPDGTVRLNPARVLPIGRPLDSSEGYLLLLGNLHPENGADGWREDALRRLAAEVPVVLLRSTAAGKLSSVVGAAEQVLERAGPSYRHRPLLDVFDNLHPDDRERVRTAVQETLEERTGWAFTLRTQEDPPRWLLTHGWYHHGGNPEIRCFVADVSWARKLQRELFEAQRRETVGQLAAAVAHDFNNLLTPILGFSRLVFDDMPDTSAHRQDLAEVLHATQQATALTAQILAFSRRRPVLPRPLDLGGTLSSMRRLLTRIVGSAGRLELIVEDELPAVIIDEAQLQQLVINLVVNARDALGPDGHVRVRLLAEAEHPSSVCLLVEDDGVGMTDEVRRQATQAFFTTKGEHGTGLGLATAHLIVEDAGGQLVIDSTPGEGTTIRVRLPAAAEKAASVSVIQEEDDDLRGPRVLVVEDDVASRRLLKRILEQVGCQVDAVAQAEDALERIEGQGLTYQLLVTDLALPGISGQELMHRLSSAGHVIPTVVVSGYVSDADKADLELNGWDAVRVVPKPFRPSQLLGSARGALRQGATPRA